MRKIYVVDNINWIARKDQWKSLSSIILVESTMEHKNKITRENRYNICSLQSSASQFAQYIRGHWGIENSLHWCLDVGFREDRSV